MTVKDKKSLLSILPLPTCLHNHFPNNHLIGNKNALMHNLVAYSKFKSIPLPFLPKTFRIDSPDSLEFTQFEQQAKSLLWIIKPG
jgi:hypothetical protein